MTTNTSGTALPDDANSLRQRPDAAAMAKLDKKRRVKDRVANGLIAGGGIFVLLAILAIFVYLLSESWPLFKPTSVDREHSYSQMSAPAGQSFVALEDFNHLGLRLADRGRIDFFRVSDGQTTGSVQLTLPEGVGISHIQRGSAMQGMVGAVLGNGQLLVFKPQFDATGVGAERQVTASVSYPYGEQPMTVLPAGKPIAQLDMQDVNGALMVLVSDGRQLTLQKFARQGSTNTSGGLSLDSVLGADPAEGDDSSVGSGDGSGAMEQLSSVVLPVQAMDVQALHIGQAARWLYVVHQNGRVSILNNGEEGISLYEEAQVGEPGTITTTAMLQGDISLLVGTSTGEVQQWFPVREKSTDQIKHLTLIRSFKVGNDPITVIQAESRRKGILAGDSTGHVGYFYTTSDRTIDVAKMADGPITALALSNHSEGLLVESTKGSSFYAVDAHHPDVSFQSLWGKVWYESYDKPDYVWQSTSASADFESKLSLVPLTFGTLKAAFWAMLLAAPLGIAGAMYTAAFMSPALRTKIKPAIELMQALPTVILGFLAGLWLAPLVSQYLPAIFSLVIIVPIVILICGFLWVQIPLEKRNRIPAGIAPLVLILPLVLAIGIAFALSQPFEQAVFSSHGGSMVSWLRSEGIDYQSQNALIIGLIMGFAVIAPIFSISEDALFAVPSHLVNGSLALGATPWQTLTRVVLPTASPGIFSALMIGLGRAVGETMIVLMATGNTPIIDLSLFNGMRTLSANVAVEMGEAEVGSTHFRVLFLSALVLFVMTFILNTAAEVVRSRLRKKYGSL